MVPLSNRLLQTLRAHYGQHARAWVALAGLGKDASIDVDYRTAPAGALQVTKGMKALDLLAMGVDQAPESSSGWLGLGEVLERGDTDTSLSVLLLQQGGAGTVRIGDADGRVKVEVASFVGAGVAFPPGINAADCFRTALEIDPRSAIAWRALGRSLYRPSPAEAATGSGANDAGTNASAARWRSFDWETFADKIANAHLEKVGPPPPHILIPAEPKDGKGAAQVCFQAALTVLGPLQDSDFLQLVWTDIFHTFDANWDNSEPVEKLSFSSARVVYMASYSLQGLPVCCVVVVHDTTHNKPLKTVFKCSGWRAEGWGIVKCHGCSYVFSRLQSLVVRTVVSGSSSPPPKLDPDPFTDGFVLLA